MQRLKETLRDWIREMFTSEFDADFVSRRWRVGRRHVEVGIDRMYASAAFARLRSQLLKFLEYGWRGDVNEVNRMMQSLNRLLDLDLSIIEFAYQTESQNRLQNGG